MSDEKSTVVVLDPDTATAARVKPEAFADLQERILITFEHEDVDVRIGITPEATASYIVAMCSAMGLPQGDLEYLADRFMREGFTT